MNISEETQQYASFIEQGELLSLLKRPIDLLPESADYLLPSYDMGQDGPIITGFFLVSKRYLCEVRLKGSLEAFDYCDLNSVSSYRLEYSTVKVQDANGQVISYDAAEVIILHDMPGEAFYSQLHYFGKERDKWIANVVEAIPIKLVLKPV